MRVEFLRKKYPKFVYEKFSWRISKVKEHSFFSTLRFARVNNLEIFFEFKIEPNILFKPRLTIENIDKKRLVKIGDRVLDNLVFHLG